MTTIVTAANAAEFLSLVPRLLGYHPTRSLVLIPFAAKRTLGAMRVDLPPDAGDADCTAATLIGMVCKVAAADAVAIVSYTDETFGAGRGIPHAELARALESRADACGLRLVDALCVAADAWGSYLEDDGAGEGRPLGELGIDPPGLAVLAMPEGDQRSGADLPATEPAARELVARALRSVAGAVTMLCGEEVGGPAGASQTAGGPAARGSGESGETESDAAADPGCAAEPGHADGRGAGGERRARGGRGVATGRGAGGRGVATGPGAAGPGATPEPGVAMLEAAPEPVEHETSAAAEESVRVDPRALAAVCAMDDLPELFEAALRWDAATVDPFDAAVLAWCLSRPALRDIALIEWCSGLAAGDTALDAQLRWERGEEYPAHVAMRMWGEGDRPDPERIATALELVRHVAALAPRDHRAGPLAVSAWLAWALGRSTHAGRYADLACELEPEHGLAEIVRSFVHAGHLPEWAFARGAAHE